MKLHKNLSIGIFAVVAGAVALGFSYSQVDMALYSPADLHISPRLFPQMAALLLLIFGVVNIFISKVLKKETFVEVTKNEWKGVWCFLGLLVYLFLFPRLGFIFSTALIGCFTLFLENNRKWQWYVIIVALTVIIFILFRFGLGVTKLPFGYPLRWFFGK